MVYHEFTILANYRRYAAAFSTAIHFPKKVFESASVNSKPQAHEEYCRSNANFLLGNFDSSFYPAILKTFRGRSLLSAFYSQAFENLPQIHGGAGTFVRPRRLSSLASRTEFSSVTMLENRCLVSVYEKKREREREKEM